MTTGSKGSFITGILRKLPVSLFGSDVYMSYTASYAWKSNQAAHFGLGFLLSSIVVAVSNTLWHYQGWWLLFALVPYLIKEGFDLARDSSLAEGVFGKKWRELIFDGLADVFFFNSGVLFPLLIANQDWKWCAIALAVFVVIAGGLYKFYVPPKAAYDRSNLPYYFRLPNFKNPVQIVSPKGTTQIDYLIEKFNKGDVASPLQHLLIRGEPNSGKTTLAIGIACEATNSRAKVRYITEHTLSELGQTWPQGNPSDTEPWWIDRAELLVIDDIDRLSSQKGNIDDILVALRRAMEARYIWVVSGLVGSDQIITWIQEYFHVSEKEIGILSIANIPIE